MTTDPILTQIRLLKKLTSSERKLVDFLSSNASRTVFENVTSLAKKTGVSKATVVRFIAKLGYGSFSDLRRELQEDARLMFESLSQRYTTKKRELENANDDILSLNINNIISNLQHTNATIDRKSFHLAAEIIQEKNGNLYACGFRTSYALAQMFHIMIKRIRPRSFLIGPQITMIPDMLLDVTGEDMLVAVFRHPYARQTVRIAKRFSDAGARILLVTDSYCSPLADLATIQIVVTAEGLSIFRSFTAIAAVLEALHLAVLRLSDQNPNERLEAAAKLFKEFDTYCDNQRNRDASPIGVLKKHAAE
ncbi:MAG: MurR/RpiR family transcriptional regulator [Desulfobacteraceae bacterium]|nr:MAG: MurR/RpiR family transcriptional regulator [Desulfobacteraceae bacterium]